MNIVAMKVLFITVVVWSCHLELGKRFALVHVAQWECYSQLLESLVMISTNLTRLAKEYLVTTGSTLLLVYNKSIVIWN